MADRQLSDREVWVLAVLTARLTVELRMVGLALACLANPEGDAISAAEARLASRFRVNRGKLNAIVGELRERGLIERSPEPRRWTDEHRLVLTP